MNRLTHSFAVAFVAAIGVTIGGFLVSFLILNIAFMSWVVNRYPYNNSMTGFAAFVYAQRVGAVCGVVAFFLVLFLVFRKTKATGIDSAQS